MVRTKEQQRERAVKREMETCIHFTGIHRETCSAGVNYRSLVGDPDIGWALKIPCLLAEDFNVTCKLRKFSTREEAEAEVKRDEEKSANFMIALHAAHDDAKQKGFGRGHGGVGSMPCPLKCGGELKYTVAGVNGHMHGRCVNCQISWME